MATHTYTDQIIIALDKHGELNVPQLATKISHDKGKTKHIVNLMASNNKIEKAGALNGEISYRLTDLGRTLADQLRPQDARPFTSTDIEKAFSVPHTIVDKGKPETVTVPPEPKASTPTSLEKTSQHNLDAFQRRSEPPRFGMLNSRQLIILPDQAAPIILSEKETSQLQRMMEATA